MKYLKRIFESLDKNELLDFCETNLVYLLDEGFEIIVNDHFSKRSEGNPFYQIIIEESNEESRLGLTNPNISVVKTPFSWNKIKDYFIPFMDLLDKNYKLLEWGNKSSKECIWISQEPNGSPSEFYTLDDILNDRFRRVDDLIYNIKIIVDVE
jgi:hypothetical protein